MVFSSFSFIFFFLPITLFIYFISNDKYKNIIICISSLIFYAWGEPKYIILMIISIFVNYLIAIIMGGNRKIKRKKRTIMLVIAIIFNILILTFFKYGNFIITNINLLFKSNISLLGLKLPIGISFYTFQILSYVIDVYKGNAKVQKNIIKLCTYISLFPQLIAGPIVRYKDIEKQLDSRKINRDKVVSGISRFVIGLSKKILIANNVALISNYIYNVNPTNSTFLLWLAAISYTLQIYFDFSGYSDMAIGLGKILGFEFLENFNYPYISKSITDFWHRWHISLSTWFRDYVYIPLGGNRVNMVLHIRNIFIVWLLTGIWHGAAWNFIIWGIYYALFLLLEKFIYGKFLDKMPNIIKHIYTLFIVVIGWVIFRVENISQLLMILKNMFLFSPANVFEYILGAFDVKVGLIFIPIGILFSIPIFKSIKRNNSKPIYLLKKIMVVILFITCILQLLIQNYNPFIYFNF